MSQDGGDAEVGREESDVQIASTKPQFYVTESGLPVGPKPDVNYPLTVLYCGNCGLPTEVRFFPYTI